MGSRRLFLGILVLLLLLFNQLGLAANNGRIGILATINLSGIEKSGLENKLAANIASILRNEGAYTVIEEKEIGKRLKKIKMEDITEYINLLSVKEISSLCRLIEVDQVIVISIEGYNEFVRKKQKSYQIKALIDWYRPEFQLVQSFRGDSISQKGMNDVIEKCARQMSGKLIGCRSKPMMMVSGVRMPRCGEYQQQPLSFAPIAAIYPGSRISGSIIPGGSGSSGHTLVWSVFLLSIVTLTLIRPWRIN